MTFIPHINSTANVTVFFDGQPHVVASGTPQYDLVRAAIAAGDLQAVRDAIHIRQSVVNLSHGNITLDGKTLMYDGRPLHGVLVDRILQVIKDAGDAGPLLAFLNNLMQNPSRRAVEELYTFLERCDLPITSDGYFLAYKRVRDDYRDCHSGTIDNSVGQYVSMPRNAVDEDQHRTCSVGLHFCSKGYLGSFGGERIMVLKINPADVVAIPVDYDFAKGRCWRYEVVGELDTNDDHLPVNDLRASYDASYDTAPVALDDGDDDAGDESPTGVTSVKIKAKAVVKATPAATAGTKPGQTSLSDAQVRDIRGMLADDWPLASIAKSIGTSTRTIARIRDGETYTHVS